MKKLVAKRPPVIRQTFKTAVHELLDEIFGAAVLFRFTVRELAEKTGLHRNTIYRLWREAEQPAEEGCDLRVSTLFLLAKAVGMKLSLVRKQLSAAAA